MKFSIAFKNLPFVPEERQVIYIENKFDERVNAIIKENYERLRWDFKRANLDFVYLPMFFDDEEIKEKVLYYAPYLTSEIMEKIELRSSYLLGYMSHIENKKKIVPSFLYAPNIEEDEWIFQGQTIDIIDKEGLAINEWFTDAIYDIEVELKPIAHYQYNKLEEREQPETSCTTSEIKVEYSSTPNLWDKIRRKGLKFGKSMVEEEDSAGACKNVAEEESLDEIREENVQDIIDTLNRTVERLRLKGMSLAAILELVVKGEPISKLHITDDNRLFLSDYLDMEIVLGARYKAVYFLFLNHPEGIILKRLEDYHKELVNYYKQTFGYDELPPKLMENIKTLEVPGNNQINVVILRIRKAFEGLFDEHLAKHYIITGKQGEPYKIPLDQNLIEWEDDYE
jgi:hypothetical protein